MIKEETFKQAVERLLGKIKTAKDIEKLLSVRERISVEEASQEEKENFAKREIDLTKKFRDAGGYSLAEYVARSSLILEVFVHENRWLDGAYQEELGPISKRMKEIEKSYGLKEGEYWPRGEGPKEWVLLSEEYESVLDRRLVETFREFGLSDIADMIDNNYQKYEDLQREGRKKLFKPVDEIRFLKELVNLYRENYQKSEEIGALYSAVVMVGATLEAKLLLKCLENQEKATEIFSKLPSYERMTKNNNPLKWNLNLLLKIVHTAGWLPNIEVDEFVILVKDLGDYIRIGRNLLHPGKHLSFSNKLLDVENLEDIKACMIVLEYVIQLIDSNE